MNAHAEIDKVWPREGRIRLIGRLHGLPEPAGSGWELLAVLRDHEEHRLRFPASVDESVFEAVADVEDFALDGLPEAVWDLHLVSGSGTGERRLRAGRHLDDFTGKKGIFVFPAQSVTTDEDATVVKPFYTIHDDLSLKCTPGTSGAHEDGTRRPELSR